MSYYVALLIFGILLLLLGLVGSIKAKELEVGTSNVTVRIVTTLLGSVLIVLSFVFNPDISLTGISDSGGSTESERIAEEERKRIETEKAAEEERKRIEAEKAAEEERKRIEAEKAAEEKRRAFIAKECGGTEITVPSQAVYTDRSNVSIASGDTEIDSDDWTSVELSYKVKVNEQNVEMSLTWYAIERNHNRSAGDTRFKSSKTFNVYNLNPQCPLKIRRVKGLITSAKSDKYYSGELRNYLSYKGTGSLKDVKVQIDAEGKNDDRIQALKATLQSFTVVLGE